MRRFILPAAVLAVAIAASILAGRANNAASQGDGSGATTADPLTTPLLSARRAPEWLRQPTTDGILARAVTSALAGLPADTPSCLSVRRGGDPIAAENAGAALIPGEAQRLTTVAALESVGNAGVIAGFTTEVVLDRADPIEDGVLQGDLYLIGGADPVLSTPRFVARFGDDRAFTSLPDLAAATVEALAEAGITAIAGDIIGVDQKYGLDQVSNADAWTAVEIATNIVGVTDGLLVDNGFEAFDEEVVDLTARVRTDDAEAHAAEHFAGWLNFLGLPSGGFGSGDGPGVADRESVATIESPAMVDIARRALVDATTAEMLYRELAVRTGFAGDLPVGGFFAVNAALTGRGLVPEDEVGNVPAIDGSGLSLLNRSRCDLLTEILDGTAGPLAPAAIAGLGPGAAADCAPATVEALDIVASARPEVTSVAGRATAANGDILTFALIVNWTPDESGGLALRGVCDSAVSALLDAIGAHPGGPALDELTPLPVAAAE